METEPITGVSPENNQEQELSFSEKLNLAKVLLKIVDNRNIFIEQHGGIDTFANVL